MLTRKGFKEEDIKEFKKRNKEERKRRCKIPYLFLTQDFF